jgi:hypothetical protein
MAGAAGLALTPPLADDAGLQLGDVVGVIVLIGGPPAIATWLIVRDAAGAGLGHAWAALRASWTRTGLLVAAFVGAGLSATTFVSSRASLTGDRAGSLFFVIFVVTPVVLLAVTCGIGYGRASFWSGSGSGSSRGRRARGDCRGRDARGRALGGDHGRIHPRRRCAGLVFVSA